jgi:hypothetical protein
MVLIVKEKNYKTFLKKSSSYILLIAMFGWYYSHISGEFREMNDKLSTQLAQKTEILDKKIDVSQKVEKIVYKEAEKCVELLGQEKIRLVQVVKDKLIIVCDYDTDVEPLFIRYGIMALVKSTPEEVRISIDLKFVVESNYEV